MTFVTVRLHFELDGMRIVPSLAGHREELLFDGYSCALVLPSEEADFGVSEHKLHFSSITPVAWQHDELTCYSIDMLRTEVRVASYLSVAHLPFGGPHEQHDLDEAYRIFDEARPIATGLARQFIQQVRVNSQQSWLGSSAWTPRETWSSELHDANGDHLAVGSSQLGPTVILFDDKALTLALHQEAVSNASQGTDPPLAEAILADAKYVNWPTGNPDKRQAVLLAAIACEVKIKQRLHELSQNEQQALLDLILENPRDVTIAVISLLDTTLRAVCGRSLRQDNRDLYKQAVRLFEDRNTIAHRGGMGLDTGRLNGHIKTAESVFEYLDSLGTKFN